MNKDLMQKAVVTGLVLLLVSGTGAVAVVFDISSSAGTANTLDNPFAIEWDPLNSMEKNIREERAIVWDVTLNFNESGGKYDYVVFGEAPDANDGPPADIYDQPKPPAQMPPYVRAWFDDGLSPPYNQLSKDYHEYNNTNYKEWNLTIHWMPDDASNTDVNVTWDSDELDDSEYDSVILYDINNNDEVDMILNSYYEFLCPAYVPQDFTINCSIIVNQPPVAVNDTVTTPEDTTVVIDVLDNDYDPDGEIDPTTVDIVDDASHGSTSVNPTTGEVTYTPDSDYYGSDNFTYTVDDDDGDTSNEATVSITVTSVNDPPVAVDDTATTPEDTPVVIDVLDNDYDPDGEIDPTTVDIVDDASHGSTSVNPTTGEVTYTPDSDYYGSDNFTYTVDDDDGDTSNEATVSITVTSVNDPPVAVDDTATTPEDTPVVIDVLDNDYDPDGEIDPTTVDIVDDASHGSTSVNPTTGVVTYTPDSGYHGSDYFTYTVDDDDGDTSNLATVNITVLGNYPPNKPDRPSGQTRGKWGTKYTYTTSTIDPDNDQIWYNFSWGDGTYSGWVGPYTSGQTGSASHTWYKGDEWMENYEIKVKAKDENELESDWSEPLPIVMPKSYGEITASTSNPVTQVVHGEDTSDSSLYQSEDTLNNLFSHTFRVGRNIGEFINFILGILRGEYGGMSLVDIMLEGWTK